VPALVELHGAFDAPFAAAIGHGLRQRLIVQEQIKLLPGQCDAGNRQFAGPVIGIHVIDRAEPDRRPWHGRSAFAGGRRVFCGPRSIRTDSGRAERRDNCHNPEIFAADHAVIPLATLISTVAGGQGEKTSKP
jgi:hypothetical protein